MTKARQHTYQTFTPDGKPEKPKAKPKRATTRTRKAVKPKAVTRKAAKPMPTEEPDLAQASHIAKVESTTAQLREAERKAELKKIEADQQRPINWRGSKPRGFTQADLAKIDPDQDAQLSKANAWVLRKAQGWLLDERIATPNTHGDLAMNKALIEAATVIGLALEAGNAHDADKPKGPQAAWSDEYKQRFLNLMELVKKAHSIEPTNCMTRQFNAALAQVTQTLNRALREGYRGR